jgi:cyanate permease
MLLVTAWLLIALAVNVPMLYAGRVIAGLCVGIVSLCFPVYLGETLQPEVRGMLGLLPTTLGNVGKLSKHTSKTVNDSETAVNREKNSALPFPNIPPHLLQYIELFRKKTII